MLNGLYDGCIIFAIVLSNNKIVTTFLTEEHAYGFFILTTFLTSIIKAPRCNWLSKPTSENYHITHTQSLHCGIGHLKTNKYILIIANNIIC